MAAGTGKSSGKGGARSGDRRADARRSDLLWLPVFAGLVVLAVTVALLASGSETAPVPTFSPTPDPTTSTEPPEEGPTEQPSINERPAAFGTVRSMAEVDGGLLLGTDDGPWLLPPDGKPERIEGPRHRLSAMVEHADGTLLGSGLRGDAERPLGLASSEDARTWMPRSLDGQALFGRLRLRGDRVYGWDAGTSGLLVSDDLQQWETRSVEQRLLDFVVDPSDGEHLLRAVPEGGVGLPEVQRSRDGGRTWKRIAAPSLFLFSWRVADRLWALTEDGTVFRSRDGGESWSPRNSLQVPPTALLDTGETIYVALQRVGVYRSADDGATWQRLDEP